MSSEEENLEEAAKDLIAADFRARARGDANKPPFCEDCGRELFGRCSASYGFRGGRVLCTDCWFAGVFATDHFCAKSNPDACNGRAGGLCSSPSGTAIPNEARSSPAAPP